MDRHSTVYILYTVKKENQIFLILGKAQIFPHILGGRQSYMTSNCSILNFLIYEENLIYFFISVHCWKRYSIAYNKCQGFNSFWQNIFTLCRESQWYNVNSSPIEVSQNVFPWTMRPLDDVSLGLCRYRKSSCLTIRGLWWPTVQSRYWLVGKNSV